jgi:TolB protein
VLGHADVYVDRNAKSFTHDEMTVELIDGSTLPIKFRIEDEWFEVAFHGPGNDFDVLLSTPPYGPGVHFANVTDSPGLDGGPAWSPDGRQMAFFSNREGTNKLFVMNWDGTGIRLVPTGVLGPYPAPAWSPDGQWIAYQGVSHGPAPDPDWDIYMVPASGGGTPTRLTFPDGDGSGGFIKYEEWEPTWHPDGDRITFAKSHDDPVDCPPAADVCDFDIVSVYWATGVEVNHTNNRDLDQDSPAWSPDGKYLIYSAEKKDEVSADPDNPRKYLWAIGMGGEDGNVPIAGPYQLTADDSGTNAEDQEASFSHDGRWILFTRAQDGPPFVLYWGNWEDWVNQKTLNYHFFTDGGGAQWRPSTR